MLLAAELIVLIGNVVCFLLFACGASYISGLSGRRAARLLPAWVGLAYLGLSLAVSYSYTRLAWMGQINMWHGPDPQFIFALRVGAMGALTAYGVSTPQGSVIWRSLAGVALGVILAGPAWGAVQLWVESLVYGFDRVVIDGVPYELFLSRFRTEIAAQARIVFYSVASVIGVLAGLRVAALRRKAQ